MSIITVTLPNDGDAAIVEPYNAAIDAILAVVNGNLDSNNISSLNGDKILAGTLDQAAFNASSNQGWISSPLSLSYGSNAGAKEFTVTAAGDLSSVLSPGMRLKISRGTTPPADCMLFVAASSQYATKVSPSGISFTGPYTAEAWIYVNSYTGSNQVIINRQDSSGAAGGWIFYLNSVGQLRTDYGTTSSFTSFQSVQSVPLKRWVHVAIAVTSVSSKTGVVYINGQAVASTSPLSAATSLTQGSVDLRIGTGGGTASGYFDGQISEVRVWSVAQTSTAIQTNMGLSLTGSETNLVVLFQGNGNFNDKTSNGNNLSAQAGAIATQVGNPYNATEYAIITSVSYSNPTTTVVLFCGTDYMIPDMVLSNAFYSTVKTPYGFPSAWNKWIVDALYASQISKGGASTSVWYNGGIQLSLPIGEWGLSYQGSPIVQASATAGLQALTTLSTSNNAESDSRFTLMTPYTNASSSQNQGAVTSQEVPVRVLSDTPYYLNQQAVNGSGTINLYFCFTGSPGRIQAKCSYL